LYQKVLILVIASAERWEFICESAGESGDASLALYSAPFDGSMWDMWDIACISWGFAGARGHAHAA